jgi:hypothetical protein
LRVDIVAVFQAADVYTVSNRFGSGASRLYARFDYSKKRPKAPDRSSEFERPDSGQVRTILVVLFVARIWEISQLPRCERWTGLRTKRINMMRMINMFNILINKIRGGEEEDA